MIDLNNFTTVLFQRGMGALKSEGRVFSLIGCLGSIKLKLTQGQKVDYIF